jgi:chorismate dehydratase
MNKANIEKIRIGRIRFANVWPVFHFFDIQSLAPYAEIVSEVPTGLNRQLREGKIDVSAISAFAYGKDCSRYVLLPDLSVSSYGRVNSILLFLKRPFEQAIHGKIALPQTSETSINLLKIIVGKFYGAFPEYITTAPSLDLMLEQADAALLIGDDAIQADWSNRSYPRIDLGELWNRWTGHWMTYAVWAVRTEAAERWERELSFIHQAFMESKRLGTQRRSEIVQTGCRLLGGTAEYWENYFRQLTYDFGQPQRDGLQLYFRYANELGLIDHEVSIQLWSDKSVTQVKE